MPKCKRPKKYQRPYDWEKINAEWLVSDCKLLVEFSKKTGIPYQTLKKNIKTPDKKVLTEKAKKNNGPSPSVLADAISGSEIVEQKRVYVEHLREATEAVSTVMRGAIKAFKANNTPYRSNSEIGNLVLRAADQNRELTSELQGIPKDDEGEAWEVTRGFWPQRYQRDFIFDTPSSLKRESQDIFIFGNIGGLGSGKTLTGAQKFGKIVELNRGLPAAVYAPTYRMLEDPNCAKHRFLNVIQEKGLSFRYHATKNSITLFGDTEILFRSMDDPEHLRGPELACAWIDEGLQMPGRRPFDVIMGRIRHPEAKEPCLIFTGTPDGLNWGYDLLVEEAELNRVQLYHGRTQDNRMIDPAYYERLSRLYDPRFAQQELEGEFIDVHRGRVYFPFSRSEHVLKDARAEKLLMAELPLDLCVDFNVAPMCWNVTQDFPHNGDVITYCLDEIHIDDTDTQKTVDEFILRYGGHCGGVRIFGDATGRARHTSASQSDYEIIFQALEAKKIPNLEKRVGRSNPLVTDRVNSMNARLRNAKGEIKFYVLGNCKETIKDFERTSFKPGTRQIDKASTRAGTTGSELSHHTDALSYKIDRLYPVRKVHVRQHGR